MIKDHPVHYHDLRKLMGQLMKKIPSTMRGFTELHAASTSEGALSSKNKELIALGIAITSHCDGCIAYHVHDAMHAGATASEILETIGVSVMMGGGPALVYGCEALEAMDQFAAADKDH